MKYKVGDKVKVRSDLKTYEIYGGYTLVKSMEKFVGKTVTISHVGIHSYAIEESEDAYWTDEMFEGLEEDELTAEELAKTIGNICEVHNECKECPFRDVDGEDYCVIRMGKNADKTLKIAKQWKADHEKKPIETEFVYIVRVIEDTGDSKKCVYEEEIPYSEDLEEAQVRVLKEYCKNHVGKFYAGMQNICRVKE